jgi:nucleoside phosphorylase
MRGGGRLHVTQRPILPPVSFLLTSCFLLLDSGFRIRSEVVFFVFTCTHGSPMLSTMLLIAAALAEELETGLNLCSSRGKIRCAGGPVWLGIRGAETLHFVKLGTGPARSAARLRQVLTSLKPSEILVIGYAGALDPALRQGELVVVNRADQLSEESWGAPLEEIGLAESWTLSRADELCDLARRAGLPVHCGPVLTSPCIMGAPTHKRMLFDKFGAAIVDMETAALARFAARADVPLSCVRAISDEALDDFFAEFSYDPGAGNLRRAARVLAAGGLMRRYSQWHERSRSARQNLSKFLACYLDDHAGRPEMPDHL